MYEAIDLRTRATYQGRNLAALREQIESKIILTSELPPHYATWSNTRCIMYLVDAKYIKPSFGPEWFMELGRPRKSYSSNGHGDKPQSEQLMLELINEDGSVMYNCKAQVTFWHSRNHVRLVFQDANGACTELFTTEMGMRDLWIALGKLMGFDATGLVNSVHNLPTPRLHSPEIAPESIFEESSVFKMLEAMRNYDVEVIHHWEHFDDEADVG